MLKQITHCDACGANWCDDGNNGTACPYWELRQQGEELRQVKEENATLRDALSDVGLDEGAARVAYLDEKGKREAAEATLKSQSEELTRLREAQKPTCATCRHHDEWSWVCKAKVSRPGRYVDGIPVNTFGCTLHQPREESTP